MATSPQAQASTNERGRYSSMMPTDGAELMQAWELSPESWENESVKVARCILGTDRVELLQSCALADYDLREIARQYGPGRYRISPGPGRNSKHQTTIQVSPEFARGNGWAQAPAQQTPGEMMAQRTFVEATRGPVDPLALSQMVEAAVLRASSAKPDNGMDALALVLKGFELAGTLQAKAMETVKGMAGLPQGSSVIEREPRSLGDALIEMGPGLLQMISGMINQPRPAQAQTQAQPMQPAIGEQPKMIPANPQTQAQPVNLPELTEEEKQAIAPILGTLRPFADKLASFLRAPVPASILAGQLAGMLGSDLDMPIVALSEVVKRAGNGVLAAVHPEFACDKGAEIVHTIAGEIIQKNTEREE